MSIRSAEEAAKAAEATHHNPEGACQAVTRGYYLAPSVGDLDHDGSPDAEDGWKSEPKSAKHTDRTGKRGRPASFLGGSHDNGHRAIFVHPGIVRSTDFNGLTKRYQAGVVGNGTVVEVERAMGVSYVGWSDTIDGIPIPHPADPTPAPKPRPTRVHFKAVAWNVWEGHSVSDVRKQLKMIIDNQGPDVIVLEEARHLFGHIDDLGYQVVQLKPKTLKKGNISNTGDVAVLIRKGLKLQRMLPLRMTKFWFGPKHHRPQDPRVYRWVRVKKNGVTWKVGGFHLPFGDDARKESFTAIRNWFRVTYPGRPAIALGDFNSSNKTITSLKMKAVKVFGRGPDLAAYKNCVLLGSKDLGLHGSDDHHAKLFTFAK